MNHASPPLIALLTDFGADSPYVAQMKGVIYGLRPEALVVDVTHSITPQDTSEAAWVLADVTDAFPPDTIFVVVVDPGVGSARQLVAIRGRQHLFVGPDNGVFSLACAADPDCQIIQLDRPEFWRSPVSATFHGRDIMAPVSAQLANGVPITALGSPTRLRVAHAFPAAVQDTNGRVVGRVEYTDKFGNLITNIRQQDLAGPPDRPRRVACPALKDIHFVRCYADRPSQTLVALIGSTGRLEIALVGGSAQAALQLPRHAQVTCSPLHDP